MMTVKRKIVLGFLALLLVSGPASAQTGEQEFRVDFFGFLIKARCLPARSEIFAKDLKTLVAKNFAEIDPCMAPIKTIFQSHEMEGYSQILFLTRLVDSLPATDKPGPAVSFAEAALDKKPLDLASRRALLFALIAAFGFKSQIMSTNQGNLIMLNLAERIDGIVFEGEYYLWEPGKNFTEVPALSKVSYKQKVPLGRKPVTFDKLPAIPWTMTREGDEAGFKSPSRPGCPEQWSFSLRRLPEYEKFFALWPRDVFLQIRLVSQVLEPFQLDDVFGDKPESMTEELFGTCLLNWLQVNTSYDQQHAKEKPAARRNRNPLEILFSMRKGICGELSTTLIGILLEAGFPPENILTAIYDPNTPAAHLNLAVEPREGKMRAEAAFIEDQDEKFYIMDPAFYIRDRQNNLLTRWGDSQYKNNKDVEVRSLRDY